REGRASVDRGPLASALAGFVLLLVASAALESLRFYSIRATLPDVPGGIIGNALAGVASGTLGFTGATLVLLTLVAIGFSLFTGISWVALSEATGLVLEGAFALVRGVWAHKSDHNI